MNLMASSSKCKGSRNFWDVVRKHHVWLAYGIYIGVAVAGWLGHLIGYVSLKGALLYTLITPIILFIIFYVRKSKHQKTFMKWVTVLGGGLALGFPIWLFLNYILYVPSWAPLHGNHGPLARLAFFLSTATSYGGAAYIMYKLGQKRGFKPFI